MRPIESPSAHTLLAEIQEQPAILEKLLSTWSHPSKSMGFPAVDIKRCVALAEGSSRNALAIAAPFIEAWCHVSIQVETPETLSQKLTLAEEVSASSVSKASFLDQTFFIVLSQSGETASLLHVLDRIPQLKTNLLLAFGVTNRGESTLAKRFPNTFVLDAGVELSIAATKTMTASLMALLLWGLSLAERRQTVTTDVLRQYRQQLASIPTRLPMLWNNAQRIQSARFTQTLLEVNHFILLSKGALTQVLPEGGLKLTETSRNIVYTDNTESFKHGPKVILSGVNGVHPNSLYLVPPSKEMATALFEDIGTHFWSQEQAALDHQPPDFEVDRVFFMMFENSVSIPKHLQQGLSVSSDKLWVLPETTSFLDSVFFSLVAFQLMSYQLARIKGENPNDPALVKAVTE